MEERVLLADGREVTIRPIRVDDLDELRRAIRDADEETLRLRFLGGRPPRTDAELMRLVDVDHDRREAFVAVAPDGRGVGIARYEALPDGRSVDMAVAVDPQWRRIGVASELLSRLVRAALRHGMDRIHADYYASNDDVADLLHRAGVPEQTQNENGVVEEVVRVGGDFSAS